VLVKRDGLPAAVEAPVPVWHQLLLSDFGVNLQKPDHASQEGFCLYPLDHKFPRLVWVIAAAGGA
jgi:hypothetical protein